MGYQKPLYQITSTILKLIQDISLSIGEVNTLNLDKPPTQLRRENRIKSIFSSLSIEGNSLSLDQVTSLVENRIVIGPKDDIVEVKNAIEAYDLLPELKPHKKSDLLRTHRILMKGLIKNAGKFRQGSVGIVKGNKIEHIAPPSHLVPSQIDNLLKYSKDKTELTLIKSCVFHYEFEFIHPFLDGNGRMGRLWQTLILMHEFPVFEFLSTEHLIKDRQEEYYKALSSSDKQDHSTTFIEYMLDRINEALKELLDTSSIKDSFESRMGKARDSFSKLEFSRIDYMKLHKTISSATASRDLKKAVEFNLISKKGDKRTTKYKFE